MVNATTISSADDPRVDEYRNLPDGELPRRQGAFVAEGRLVVRRLLTAPAYRVRSVLVTPAARDALGDVLARTTAPIYVASLDLLQQITGFNIHRGCLAIAERPAPISPHAFLGSDGPLLVLEGVGNADNVGLILRNAAAFSASGVVMGAGCCDPLYRKAIRTSMGAALTVPTALDPIWPSFLTDLRTHGWTVVALTPDRSACDLETFAREPSRRVAFVLGSEADGLSAAALAAVDRHARIPMSPAVDSLNVAVAAAVALYALTRGR
jgi:tRNA G18 (ribose-2'-O)-methylase SpoU